MATGWRWPVTLAAGENGLTPFSNRPKGKRKQIKLYETGCNDGFHLLSRATKDWRLLKAVDGCPVVLMAKKAMDHEKSRQWCPANQKRSRIHFKRSRSFFLLIRSRNYSNFIHKFNRFQRILPFFHRIFPSFKWQFEIYYTSIRLDDSSFAYENC